MALIEQIQTFANTVVGKTYEEAGIRVRYRKDKDGNQTPVTELAKGLYAAANLPVEHYVVLYDLQEDASGDPDGTHKEKVKITGITVKGVYEKLENQTDYIIARSDTSSRGSGIYRKVEAL